MRSERYTSFEVSHIFVRALFVFLLVIVASSCLEDDSKQVGVAPDEIDDTALLAMPKTEASPTSGVTQPTMVSEANVGQEDQIETLKEVSEHLPELTPVPEPTRFVLGEVEAPDVFVLSSRAEAIMSSLESVHIDVDYVNAERDVLVPYGEISVFGFDGWVFFSEGMDIHVAYEYQIDRDTVSAEDRFVNWGGEKFGVLDGIRVPLNENDPVWSLPSTGIQPIVGLVTENILSGLTELGVIEVQGREDLGDVGVWHIGGDIDAGELVGLFPEAESGNDVRVRFWVGTDGAFVHRIEVYGAMNMEEDESLIRIVHLSQFDGEPSSKVTAEFSELSRIMGEVFAALESTESFRVQTNYESSSRPYTGLGELFLLNKVDARVFQPDRARGVLIGTRPSDVGTYINTELLVVGDEVWTRSMGDDDWKYLDGMSNPFVTLFAVTDHWRFGAAVVDTFEIVREVEYNGVMSWLIEGVIDSGDVTIYSEVEAGYPVSLSIWVAQDSYLIQAIRSEGRVNQLEPEGIVRMTRFSEYGHVVPIEAP